MMTQEEKSQYERASNAAAGYCATDAYVETKPNGVMNDEEAEKAVQES